jgi:hypothetical protein
MKYTILILLALTSPASAQVVVPAQCPAGFRHEGAFCVGEEGGTIHRIPYADFMRGGRYFGRPFYRPPVVVHRPVVRAPVSHRPPYRR